ncbi:hypothetical protein C1637_17310 [Chryseobacterium lactis]|uniref:C1q domain-containing protein n=1 Tax=Chryseobacterium lactis TaxID=1241981 RepID=A0A3G6RF54_CHRLC|nr:hypothetical protein [Chryseobacterium lactis]AZA83002.1 hypothetical protein EG342_14445 [Chryseobacterium lactis]AZB03385.1 hypothetical protein EG341_05310 [Chryseobacterium lactis]PNW12329.1 hypothetical protein C1637_17310 [Chryseobacterium lactis]
MKKTLQFTFLFIFMLKYAQVGILTGDPQATLDINGNTMIRQVPQTTNLSGYQFLLLNQNNSEVSQIDQANITFSDPINPSVYAAKKTTGISLLNLSLFPPGFQSINFTTVEKTIGNPDLFSNTDNAYVVPSDGIYFIGYTFRYGTGLQAAVLSNNPGIGVIRTRNNTAEIIDNRIFSGVNLSRILSLTISESTISSVYALQAGDKISFGLLGGGLLDLGLLGSSSSSFYIFKISN